MDTSTNQPQAILEIESDELGNWEARIPQDLSPGMHKVMVETENGEQQDIALFNMPIRTELVDRPTEASYNHYLYPLALLTILVLLLAVNSLRLMAKAKKDKLILEKRQKQMTIVATLAALFSIIVFVYVAMQSGWFQSNKAVSTYGDQGSVTQNQKSQANVAMLEVKGLIMDPLSNEGVNGVDLSVGEVSIRTQAGGAYNFANIPSNTLIKISHPDLKKLILKTVAPDEQGQMNVYFNTQMLNSLITVIDDEATGKYSSIYKQMPESVKNNISLDLFIKNFQPSFSISEMAQQSINIVNQKVIDAWTSDVYNVLFEKVVQIDVDNNNQTISYYLVNQDGEWQVIK